MTNNDKIKKLEFLLDSAIMNICPSDPSFDENNISSIIDNIIKIEKYITELKHKGENIAYE